MTWITSTRMYDVAPAAKAAWHALLQAAHRAAGLEVEFIEHGWPTPIGELWTRPGLCGAFMCGWPFACALADGRHYTAVASVVPDFPGYEGQARYRSEFLVRADSTWTTLEDARGSRYGWMVRDSQSGWNAPRATLSALGSAPARAFFSEVSGPYGNPHGLLRALSEGAFDLTAIDGWYLDLIRAHEPARLSQVRSLAFTPWTPNPLLVAGPDVDPAAVARLKAELLGMHEQPQHAALLRQAHVARFVPADVQAYGTLIDMAQRASARGYEEIA